MADVADIPVAARRTGPNGAPVRPLLDGSWSKPGEEVAAALAVPVEQGLTGEEAARRKTRYGPNRLREHPRRSLWSILLDQFKSLIVGLLAGAATSLARFDALMAGLGYDPADTSTDYAGGSPAALGNYIVQCLIDFGLHDGSNEQDGYGYTEADYRPVNPPLDPTLPGNPDILDLNHWQPLILTPTNTPRFLTPHWGRVTPFALTEEDLTLHERDGTEFRVYHDPGPPPQIDSTSGGGLADDYKWTFALVAVWSGHLDPASGVISDCSPATNIWSLRMGRAWT